MSRDRHDPGTGRRDGHLLSTQPWTLLSNSVTTFSSASYDRMHDVPKRGNHQCGLSSSSPKSRRLQKPPNHHHQNQEMRMIQLSLLTNGRNVDSPSEKDRNAKSSTFWEFLSSHVSKFRKPTHHGRSSENDHDKRSLQRRGELDA